MQAMFNHICNNYITAKKTAAFKGNVIADYVRNVGPQIIKTQIQLEDFIIKGSSGQVNWADIPWIAIINPSITNTAQDGYYIVYLFCKDMSGVYLSLNQGCTTFFNEYSTSKALKKIDKCSKYWAQNLNLNPNLTLVNIDLKCSNKLARGYEKGHICGKFYDANSIPSNKQLVNDLNDLIITYNRLKQMLSVSTSTQYNVNVIKI